VAKSKVTDVEIAGVENVEVVPTETVIQTEAGPLKAEVVDQKPKAFRFELLAGTHYSGDVPFKQGDTVESDDDLSAIYGSTKFRRLE
jgi:hypothetical protein